MHTDKNRKPKFHTPTIMQINFLANLHFPSPFFPPYSPKWGKQMGFLSTHTFQGITVLTVTSTEYNKLAAFLLPLCFAHFLTDSQSFRVTALL